MPSGPVLDKGFFHRVRPRSSETNKSYVRRTQCHARFPLRHQGFIATKYGKALTIRASILLLFLAPQTTGTPSGPELRRSGAHDEEEAMRYSIRFLDFGGHYFQQQT